MLKNKIKHICIITICIIFALTFKVYATKSNNTLLKDIQTDLGELTPKFEFQVTNYWINVLSDVEKVNINATADDVNAKVSIVGNENLQEGLNKVEITVTAEDGVSTKKYLIEIIKGDINIVNTALKDLRVNGFTIAPIFNTTILDYVVEVPNDVTTLDIVAIPENSKATIEIKGNLNLVDDLNNIEIKVVAEDLKATRIYNLTVAKIGRNVQEETNLSNDVENVIESNQTNEENEITDEETINEVSPKIKNMVSIVVSIITVIIIIILSIIFYKTKRGKDDKPKKKK